MTDSDSPSGAGRGDASGTSRGDAPGSSPQTQSGAAPLPATQSASQREAESLLPRAALERVLARATELQTQTSDSPEVISEARLLDIGREVGIDPNHLRLAIAEERGRSPMLPEEPGRIALALGDAHAGAQRPVPGSPEKVLAALDRWMQREEQFVVKRRFGTRMSWEKKRNAFASISRGLSGRTADLTRADEVSAVVTDVDGARSLVRLDADLRLHRKSQRDGAVVLGVVNGVLAAAWITPLAVLGAVTPADVSVLPFVAMIGVGLGIQAGISTMIWRGIKNSFRSAVARTQLRLEQLLDALEHGDAGSPPSLLEQLRQTLLPPKL